jgi:hypothetical protein
MRDDGTDAGFDKRGVETLRVRARQRFGFPLIVVFGEHSNRFDSRRCDRVTPRSPHRRRWTYARRETSKTSNLKTKDEGRTTKTFVVRPLSSVHASQLQPRSQSPLHRA